MLKTLIVRNNIIIHGDGSKSMLLVHGYGCDQNMWRYITPHFKDDYKIILIDLVGSGKSDENAYDFDKYSSLEGYANDIVEICDALDLKDVCFVGHSVSAMIGALAAIKNPSIFKKLIMIGPSPRYINDADYFGGFSRKDIDELLETLDANYLGWSSAMAPVIMGNPDRPELAEELEHSFCQNNPAIARHFAKVTFLGDNRSDLDKLTTETLILQSKSDAIAPIKVGQYVHNHIANSELVILDATGHCPHLSAPDQTIKAIKGYLKSTNKISAKPTMNYNIDYKELHYTFPSGYFCSLPDGTIIDSNKKFLELISYEREEVIEKKKFSDFLSLGGKIYFETVYSKILRLSGTIEEINFDFIKKDGTKLPVLINSIEVKDTAGNHLFTQSSVFNISQRKKYERELLIAKRKAKDLSDELTIVNKELRNSSELIFQQKLQLELNNHLEKKNSQLSNFAHIASHNLRAPVSNLLSLTDFYNESTNIEDKAMLFNKIEIVIGHLNETLSELIESIKIQEDINITHDPTIFNTVFNKTVEILEDKILNSKAIVTSNFSEAPKIDYPKLYLESILLNLMSNSIRYRSPDRIPTVHFCTEINNNEITLMATDNGLGIDLKKHGHRLFGLNNTFHRHTDSKGVGLFMTKTQIDALGGSIKVESEINKGTTFKIILKKNIS